LAKVGTFDSDLKRLVIVLVYHAVGRGGEVAFLNLSGMRFDQDEHGLWTGWGEPKTGHDGDIPYFPSKEEWLTCVLHALGVYIILAIHYGKLNSNRNPDDPIWLLPNYQGLANGGAATKISRILTELEKTKKVEGLSKDHTSHGLRAGSSDDLALNEAVDVISIICRGNWCVVSVSVGFSVCSTAGTQRICLLFLSFAGTSRVTACYSDTFSNASTLVVRGKHLLDGSQGRAS
jgi:hypothetical protein